MRSVLRFKENLIPVRGLFFSGPLSPLLLQHLCCYSVAATQWQNERVPIKCSNLLYEFTTYCYSRDLPRAMQALNSLQKHKIWADAVTYSELIKCCLARGAVEQGKRVHQHVFSNGYEPKTFLFNTIMNMYVKFKMLDEAQDLFDQMSDRNVVSWTTMIAAYSSAKINNKALEFLILMRRDGVRPNMFTYSSVLRACDDLSNLRQLHCSILKVGLESDVFVRSALIDVYSKMGQLECAMCTFNEMVTGDLVVWNSIIGGFAQNSDGDEALMLFKRMKRAGFSADQSTLTSVLRACTSLALLELGRQVHVHVVKFQRDLILDNALLDMYCKCGNLEDAHQIFTQMIEKDVISWSTMIIGYAQNGFSRKALELFNEMKVSGIKPNYITVLGVLFACSHAGLVEDGQYYFHSMKKLFGIDPGREHYGCMVDLLGRSGKLDEAVKLIREMECEPDAVTWRTLLGACRVHRNMDLAEYAAKQIIKLDPSDAGTYILLSNIYARTQKWEDVEDLRRSMKERGVKKEPGCSWVEVNKQIHAFIMGDNSHPQIKEINKELNQIIWKLKEAGYVPDTNFVLQDLEDEQMEDSLLYHSEKIAVAFGVMSLSREKTIRIRKNLRICGDCHLFAKLLAQIQRRSIVIRDPIRSVTFVEIVAMMKALCYSDSPKLLLHPCRILQKALLLENLMRTHRYFEESEQHRMKHNVLVHEAAVGFIRVHSLLNLHLHWHLRVSRLAIRITARFTEILKIANVEAELTSHIYQRKDRLEHILYVTGICTDS